MIAALSPPSINSNQENEMSEKKKRLWYLDVALWLSAWTCIVGLFLVWAAVAYLSGWGLVSRLYDDGWFVKVLVIAWNVCFWTCSLSPLLAILLTARWEQLEQDKLRKNTETALSRMADIKDRVKTQAKIDAGIKEMVSIIDELQGPDAEAKSREPK